MSCASTEQQESNGKTTEVFNCFSLEGLWFINRQTDRQTNKVNRLASFPKSTNKKICQDAGFQILIQRDAGNKIQSRSTASHSHQSPHLAKSHSTLSTDLTCKKFVCKAYKKTMLNLPCFSHDSKRAPR